MWQVVKFLNVDDVSAVLFSWIKTNEETGETLCFWPRTNAEKKRSKPYFDDFSDGTFYPCRILMGGAKFDTLKKAIAMEIRAQDHSSVETNDESTNKKRKRIPKKRSPSEESSCVKKKRKIKAAKVAPPSDDETSSESSDDSLAEAEQMDEYVFKRSKTLRLRDCSKFDVVVPNPPAVEYLNPKSISVFDVVTVVAAKDSPNSLNTEPENLNGFGVHTSNTCEEANQPVFSSPVNVNLCDKNAILETAHRIGDIIELPCDFTGDAAQSTLVLSLFEEISKLNSKLDLVLNNQAEMKNVQEGVKNVIVDLTYKVLRVEEQLELKNTQQLTLSQELSIPIACPESLKLNEAALLAKNTTSENLVSYICSVNFQSELELFIKQTFQTVFDLEFFYKKMIWKTEPEKFNIKETEVMKCIVRSVKGRFPSLRMKPIELDNVIYTTGKKLKDAYRKRPKNV